MRVSITDVLVIGGGPAGLAAAIEARLAGFDALVIERCRPPVDAACGEGLMPMGVERLRDLGVEIPELDRAVFRGIRYLDGRLTAESLFKRGVGLGIRRSILHDALHRRAMEVGVEIRWGERAVALGPRGLETSRGLLSARWMVAADGRLSMVRKWAGLEGSAPKRRRFGVRRHYAVAPWSDLVEVHWADSAEAYVTPIGPDTVGVALMSSELPVDFDRLLQSFPDLRARLEGAESISRDRGAGPFGHRPLAVARGNLALLGDASGSLDPITGEGLSIAFAQAHSLIRALERGRIGEYAAAHRRIERAPRLITGLLLGIERHGWLKRRVVQTLASHPSLFTDLVDVAACGQLSSILPDFGAHHPATQSSRS
jgi:flavin-dependent dehydrogenase